MGLDCLVDDQVYNSFTNTKVRSANALVKPTNAILLVDPLDALSACQLALHSEIPREMLDNVKTCWLNHNNSLRLSKTGMDLKG